MYSRFIVLLLFRDVCRPMLKLRGEEVLIRFLRFPECPFLLHGVEHSVAILSLVLVRETDDRQLSVILFYVYK